jgi:hypothetical protein
MSKPIQICASQNDLFGLDADGVVYHYNFNTNHRMRLGDGWRGAETEGSRPASPLATEHHWDGVQGDGGTAPTRRDRPCEADEEAGPMQVVAISSPRCPEWHWRIMNYAGEVIEESQAGFPCIAAAVAAGKDRLRNADGSDVRT